MQIDLGEAEIGVWQIAQARHRIGDGHATGGHGVQQSPQGFRIHDLVFPSLKVRFAEPDCSPTRSTATYT
jgi:hypothetical protein